MSLSLSSETTQAKSGYFIIARINETKLYVYGGFFLTKNCNGIAVTGYGSNIVLSFISVCLN